MSDKKISDFPALVPGTPGTTVFPASYLGVTYKINIVDAVNSVNPQGSTTVTGILLGNGTTTSAATGNDLPVMTTTARGAVTTPPNDATKFLNGQGGWTVPPGSASGSGTVTSFAIAAANGFDGTVATSTTTPTLTMKTTITGLLKGNGTAISAASNSDLPAMSATVGGAVPTPPNDVTKFLRGDGTFAVPPGTAGTVTSVSVASANGFAGSVATATSTPAISVQTSVIGLLNGDGTGVAAAINSDLPAMSSLVGGAVPTPPNDATKYLNGQGNWVAPGTVTSFSIVPANGFSGSVTNPTITPALTLTTSITGVLKGSGGALATATGNDLPVMTATTRGAVPTPPNNTTTFLRGDGTFAAPSVGTGTVTTMSVVTTNGFGGSVTNPTTTPALTLTTSVNGMVKGNGTALSAASDGTDYISPTTGDARYAKINTPFVLQNTGLNGINLSSNGTWGSAAVAYAINAPIKSFQSITGPTPIGFGVSAVTAAVMGETRYDFNSSSGECVGGYFASTGIGTPGPAPADVVGVSGTAIKFNTCWMAGGHFDVYDHSAGGTSIGVNIEMAMVQSGTNTYGIVINDTSGGAVDAGILFGGGFGASFASIFNIQSNASVVLNFTGGVMTQFLSMTSATGPIYYAPGTPPSFINARIPIMIDGAQYYIPISNV